jgi:hypothetical protein
LQNYRKYLSQKATFKMSNQQIIIQNYNKNMSGLTIEEAQEHIEVLRCKMEEEIDYYKKEIQLALQDAAHDKKWADYQKYLNEWEQNAEEAENEIQLKINEPYVADSKYDFWENYDEREDYNSKSEEDASEDSGEDSGEEDDMNIYILRRDAYLLANDDASEDSGEEEEADEDSGEDAEKRVDNVITYQLLQRMFDYQNAEPEYCCKNDEEFLEETRCPTTRQGYQNEEEIRILKEQVNLLKQQVSKLEETNTLLIRAMKEQIGINF